MAEPINMTLAARPPKAQTVGDLIQLEIQLAAGGTAVDPTSVIFKWIEPSEITVTTLTYGVDAELVKAAVGIYTVNLSLITDGVYNIRWEAGGDYVGAREHQITVAPSLFD